MRVSGRHSGMRRLCFLPLVVVLTGCSFFLAKGPPADFERRPEACTYDSTWPAVDGMWASVWGLTTLAGGVGGVEDTGNLVAVALGGALTAVHLVAAIAGSVKVGRCRRAYGAMQERLGGPVPDPTGSGVWP